MSIITANPYRRLECESGLFLKDLEDIVQPENVMVLSPMENSGDRNDAIGAFHPGAAAFRRVHGLGPETEYRFNNRTGRYSQCESVIREIERRKAWVIVGFHHGYQHAVQFGLRSPAHPRATTRDESNWADFHDAIATSMPRGLTCPVLVWFACTTGKDPDGDPDTAPGSGDGSFADLSRDELCDRWLVQCRVVAHTTAGHSWFNRDLKCFDGNGDPEGGIGAELLAVDGPDDDETATLERRKLARLLKTDWAHTFPFRTIDAIRSDLS